MEKIYISGWTDPLTTQNYLPLEPLKNKCHNKSIQINMSQDAHLYTFKKNKKIC